MSLTYITMLPELPPRPDDGHKGSFGKVLIIAGSRGMSGAAALSGQAALRGGAGLVTLAVPSGILPIVAAMEPSYLTVPLPEDAQGRIAGSALRELLTRAKDSSAVACGPGCGTSADLQSMVLTLFQQVARPLVIDADGLNCLAKVIDRLPTNDLPAPRILTPHPGEFARLTGKDTAAVQQNRESLAVEFAAKHKLVLLLKGRDTLITDGARVAINTTGNSGMATGGTGDVLTGLITALLAQKMPAFEAAQLGAHLHGLAGDLAAAELTRPGLIASDLPRFLPAAWKQVGAT